MLSNQKWSALQGTGLPVPWQIRWILVAALLVLVVSNLAPAAEESNESDDAAAKQDVRGERMEQMLGRAKRTVIRRVGAEEDKNLPLNPQPLFRYDDEPRSILDGAVWRWPAEGRPLAIQKIERYKVQHGKPEWFFCVASLSEAPIEVISSGGIRWASAKAGVDMRELRGAPKPSGNPVGRSVQMKNMVRRLTSQMSEPPINVVQQMRLLARPLDRYSDPSLNIIDGAIFGFATNGTNPDLLVLVEIVKSGDSSAGWRYGLARMSIAQLNVSLDETEVWSVPYVRPPGPGKTARFDTWAFSWEPMG